MAFTYSGNPSASNLDQVRFLIQDTITTDPLLQDAEINYFLVSLAPRQAAVAACRTLARKFARQPGSRSIGDVSISHGDLSARYSTLASDLAAENASLGIIVPSPYLSGAAQSLDPAVFQDEDTQWANNASLPAHPDLTARNV